MKHTFLNIGKIAAAILLTSFLSFSSFSASAKASKKTENSISITPQVKYLGTDEYGANLISVSFESPVPVKFEIAVSDANSEEVFSREFEATKFNKVFKLVNNNVGDSQVDLVLAVNVINGGATHYYKLSGNVETVNNVAIEKQ